MSNTLNGERATATQEKRYPRLKKYTAGAIGFFAIYTAISLGPSTTQDLLAATTHSPLNDDTSEAVSELLGFDVRVDCNNDTLDRTSPLDPLVFGEPIVRRGSVMAHNYLFQKYILPVMTLRETICTSLTTYSPPKLPELIETTEQYTDLTAYTEAVYVALHEGEHTRQIDNEAEASCYAFQKLPAALAGAGIEPMYSDVVVPDLGFSLGLQYPDTYLSDECRPGGAYDLSISQSYLQKIETSAM
jgi:hypothetical protein